MKEWYYLVFLSAAALMMPFVLAYTEEGFDIEELLALRRAYPWILPPLLIPTFLAVLFTDRGYARAVGKGGALLLIASAVVMGGSLVWMASAGDLAPEVTLCHYRIRCPLVPFVVASGFMRGGAVAVLLSVLSCLCRRSDEKAGDGAALMAVAVLVSVAALWLVLFRAELGWRTQAWILFGYAVLLLPAVLCGCAPESPEEALLRVQTPREESFRKSALPVLLLGLSLSAVLSYWFYMPSYWVGRPFTSPLNYYKLLSVSSLVFGAVLLLCRRRLAGGGAGRRPAVVGAVLLLLGFPLSSALMQEPFVALVPQFLLGTGLALVVGATLRPVLGLAPRRRSLLLLGLVTAVILLSRLLVVAFDRAQEAFQADFLTDYVFYPLLSLTVLWVGLKYEKEMKN